MGNINLISCITCEKKMKRWISLFMVTHLLIIGLVGLNFLIKCSQKTYISSVILLIMVWYGIFNGIARISGKKAKIETENSEEEQIVEVLPGENNEDAEAEVQEMQDAARETSSDNTPEADPQIQQDDTTDTVNTNPPPNPPPPPIDPQIEEFNPDRTINSMISFNSFQNLHVTTQV